MNIVPLNATPRQTLQVQLDEQPCTLNIYQTTYGLFVDVYLANAAIILGVIAENLNRIVRSTYLGFSGDFAFVDTQGSTDPVYTGLGARYQLVYFTEADLEAVLAP